VDAEAGGRGARGILGGEARLPPVRRSPVMWPCGSGRGLDRNGAREAFHLSCFPLNTKKAGAGADDYTFHSGVSLKCLSNPLRLVIIPLLTFGLLLEDLNGVGVDLFFLNWCRCRFNVIGTSDLLAEDTRY
jgi:hypothetical protein